MLTLQIVNQGNMGVLRSLARDLYSLSAPFRDLHSLSALVIVWKFCGPGVLTCICVPGPMKYCYEIFMDIILIGRKLSCNQHTDMYCIILQ